MNRTAPSLGEALATVHARLLNDLGKLDDAVRRADPDNLAEVRLRLSVARRHIEEHFRLEEHDGYMDAIRALEPRFEPRIQRLLTEHHDLRHDLDAIVDAANAGERIDEKVAEEIRAWIRRVRLHERSENKLFQDAFNHDFAAED